jgi:Mg-chelatase subunit ChlD
MKKKILFTTLGFAALTALALTKSNTLTDFNQRNQSDEIKPECYGESTQLNLNQENNIATQQQAKIQVVFTLDCTGSMSGLIQAAKDKIWSIATGMTQTNPKPDISFGFVFYRDVGDLFVTKKIELTNDMDMAYRQLMEIQAAGGGDLPESVNQALFESINDFQWDADNNVYKVVFLVGDAPPHMDYQNDVKYTITCYNAVKKDIIINTIQCGNISSTTPIWQDIALRAGGEYLHLSQTGSEIVIRCPHDTEISRLMNVIDNTRVYYGTVAQRTQSQSKVNASEQIKGKAGSDVQAKRAEYNYSSSLNKAAYMGQNELITDIQSGKVKLEEIKPEQLPDNMKQMTMEERRKYVTEMTEKRKKAEAELAVQIKEREVYVAKETAKLGEDAVSRSFSAQVHKVVVKQAKTKNITIDNKVKQ